MNPLTTWDEFGEMLARAQRTAAKNYDAVADLAYALNEAMEDLNNLANLAIRLTPPETPARPLEAVLADIRALGHKYTIDSNYGYGGKVHFASKLTEPRWDNSGEWDEEKWARHAAYEREVEAGDVFADDPLAAAEARLAQIRELREQQRAAVVALVETLSYRPETVHFAPVFGQDMVCGRSTRWPGVVHTEDPSAVTCPACREWMDTNAVLSEEDIEGFLAAIGAGPEEVDIEHEARMEWVVEPLAPLLDGAVSEAELMYGPGAYNQHEPSVYDDATHIIGGTGFVRIPSGQDGRYAVGELSQPGAHQLPWKVVELKPGEAPAIVFEFAYRLEAEDCRDALNTGAFTPLMDMDPDIPKPGGPTDAEEALATLDEHESNAWTAAHGHAEEAALARADHERVRMASEGEEA